MNRFTHEFHTAAHDIRLTGAERRRIHANLRRVMEARGVPSPYWSELFMPRFFVPALAVLIIVAAGGTAYAAQGALPGDTLYPIKVSITEPIQGALALTSAAKADWNAKVAAERLDEAQALAAKGQLTATTSAELAANFSEHATAIPESDAAGFSTLVAAKSSEILDAGEGSGSATSAKASGSLVLAIASRHAEPNADSFSVSSAIAPANAPAPLMAPMLAKRSSVMEAPVAADTESASVSDDDALALNLSIEAHDALFEATSTIAARALDASTSAEAADRVHALADLVVKAEAERAVGSTTDSVSDFTKALKDAADLHLFLDGELNQDVPLPDPVSHEPFPI